MKIRIIKLSLHDVTQLMQRNLSLLAALARTSGVFSITTRTVAQDDSCETSSRRTIWCVVGGRGTQSFKKPFRASQGFG